MDETKRKAFADLRALSHVRLPTKWGQPIKMLTSLPRVMSLGSASYESVPR
ncbi:MAG: hypothetical protein WCI05_08730 [Myxococcales bacterium]